MAAVLRILSIAILLLAAGTAFPTLASLAVLGLVGYGSGRAVAHVARCARREGWLAEI